jgi:hypothetical protein
MSYDSASPFQCPLIADIILGQWFKTASTAKPDYEATAHMLKQKAILVNLLLLVITAVCF